MIITRWEQGTEDWLTAKIGVLSGTRIKKIITPSKLQLSSSYADTILLLIDENVTGLSSETFRGNAATERGNELEPYAKKAYTDKTGIEIKDFGLCLSDKNDLHGCSPDGFTPDFRGGVEIKCPGYIHLKYINDNIIPSEYILQITNYFVVNEKLEWLDFVSYRPEFIHNPIFIKRVTREDLHEQITALESALNTFFSEYKKQLDKFLF